MLHESMKNMFSPMCIAIFFIACFSNRFAQSTGSAAAETNKQLTRIENSQKNITKLLNRIYAEQVDQDYQKCEIKDVAKGKSTYQSSLWDPQDSYKSDFAVDGDLNTFSHTTFQYKPYWTVDLGESFKIKAIHIYNRRNCCGERIHDVNIYVGISHNNFKLCNHYTGPSSTGEHLKFKCQQQLSGRYVKIIIIGTGYMQLAEVKVYASVKCKE